MKGQLGKIAMVALFAVFAVGCGNSMQSHHESSGNGSLGGGTTEPQVQWDKIETELAAAESALADAEQSLSGLIQNGQIVVPTSNFGAQSLTGIAEKVEDLLNKLYDKITMPVQRAKDLINEARAKIASALSKLDPNNPLHLTAIAKLMELSKRLDDLEGKFSGVYVRLAEKVDVLIEAVDKLAAKLDLSNPLMLIPYYEIMEVRRVIVEFQTRLASI